MNTNSKVYYFHHFVHKKMKHVMIVQSLHSLFKQETIYVSFSLDFKENMNICFSEQKGKWVRVGASKNNTFSTNRL